MTAADAFSACGDKCHYLSRVLGPPTQLGWAQCRTGHYVLRREVVRELGVPVADIRSALSRRFQILDEIWRLRRRSRRGISKPRS
jgi:hypothetical protein